MGRTPVSLPLTALERSILVLVSYGLYNGQISGHIKMPEWTTANRLKVIYDKLDVHERAHAVRAAFEFGILGPGDVAFDINGEEIILAESKIAASQQPAPSLKPPTERNDQYQDQHIAACFAAEACWCRLDKRKGSD